MWPFGRRKKDPIKEFEKENEKFRELEKRAEAAAKVNGRHYSKWSGKVRSLKRQKKYDEAIKLLNACMSATERESTIMGWGVAPWYYEQTAIIYREQGKINEEIAVLEMYMHRQHGRSGPSRKLSARLGRARELKAKHKAAA